MQLRDHTKNQNVLLSEFHDWMMLSLNYLIYFIRPDWIFGFIKFQDHVIRASMVRMAYLLFMCINYFCYIRCIKRGDIRIILLAGTAPVAFLLILRKYIQTNTYPLLPILIGTSYMILTFGQYYQLKKTVSLRKVRYLWEKVKVRTACCVYLTLFVTCFGVQSNNTSSSDFLPSIVKAEAGEIWDCNQEYLAYWKTDRFKMLSEQERIELCEKLIQIECMYYEMEPLHIVIEEYPQSNRLGYYSHSDRLISISSSVITGSRSELLDTLLHEFHHSYAHTLVEEKGFSSQEAALYKTGLRTYRNDRKTWDNYYSNPIEVAAREYAAEWTNYYLTYVDSIAL